VARTVTGTAPAAAAAESVKAVGRSTSVTGPPVTPAPFQLELVRQDLAHGRRHEVRDPHEVRHERVRGAEVHLPRGADLVDAAGLHHRDPVGDRERLLLVVRDQDRRLPERALDLPELRPDTRPQLRVEVRQRLVEQQHVGLDHEGPRQGHPLLLAAGQLERRDPADPRQAHELEHLLHPAADLRATDAAAPESVRDVLEHAEVREERVVLEDDRGGPALRGEVVHTPVLDPDLAGIRPDEARDQAQERRLPAPGRPEKRKKLAVPDVQGDMAYRFQRAESFYKVVQTDIHDMGFADKALGGATRRVAPPPKRYLAFIISLCFSAISFRK
jgi:hypothetical protein